MVLMRDSQYLSVCKKHSTPVITRWERIIMPIRAALGVIIPWITVSNKHVWWAYYAQSTGKAFVGIKMNRWPWVLWRDMNQREKREASKTDCCFGWIPLASRFQSAIQLVLWIIFISFPPVWLPSLPASLPPVFSSFLASSLPSFPFCWTLLHLPLSLLHACHYLIKEVC